MIQFDYFFLRVETTNQDTYIRIYIYKHTLYRSFLCKWLSNRWIFWWIFQALKSDLLLQPRRIPHKKPKELRETAWPALFFGMDHCWWIFSDTYRGYIDIYMCMMYIIPVCTSKITCWVCTWVGKETNFLPSIIYLQQHCIFWGEHLEVLIDRRLPKKDICHMYLYICIYIHIYPHRINLNGIFTYIYLNKPSINKCMTY